MSKEAKTLNDMKRELGLLANEIYGLGYKIGHEKTVEEDLYQKYRDESSAHMEGFSEGIEKGRRVGREEGWELGRMVFGMFNNCLTWHDLQDIFGPNSSLKSLADMLKCVSYADAAKEIAEWEHAKEEKKGAEDER